MCPSYMVKVKKYDENNTFEIFLDVFFFNILYILLPWDTPSLDIIVSVFPGGEQI